MTPSTGYTPLQRLTLASGPVDVIGVVVDFQQPGPTRGTDWQCTFNLADEHSSYEGQRVKIFCDRRKIPPIRGTGDVVILKHIQLKNYLGANILLSNFRTRWTVFSCEQIPEARPRHGQVNIPFKHYKDGDSASHFGVDKRDDKPSLEDMLLAIDLCNIRSRWEWTSKTADPATETSLREEVVSSVPQQPRDKFSLIQDIGANRFFDLVGQVVKMFTTGDRLDLYITDYTENSLLFDYSKLSLDDEDTSESKGDTYFNSIRKKKAWNGPSGKLTLTVTLFWPHSSYAQNKVRENDYVSLRNVHVKLGRDGSARLEGSMHTDKKFPERVDIRKVSAETEKRVVELLKRKKKFQQQSLQDDSGGSGMKGAKRQHDDSRPNDIISKTQQKRARKRTLLHEAEQEGQASKELAKKPPSAVILRNRALLELNKNITCMHPNKDTRTIADINDLEKTHTYTTPGGNCIILPFQNVMYRSKVRVVDFQPSSLEDFAVRTSEFDCLEDNGDEGSCCSQPRSPSLSPAHSRSGSLPPQTPMGSDTEEVRKRWAWFFTLYVEDASDLASKGQRDRLALHIADEDAEFLLGLTAGNLRRRPELLTQLRERLFQLWGDLEERQRAATADGAARDALSPVDTNGKQPISTTIMPKKANPLETESREAVKKLKDSSRSTTLCRPFICCIKEYGIQKQDYWLRRFRMFGTTIRWGNEGNATGL